MKNNWDFSDYEIIKEIHFQKRFQIFFLLLITIGILILLFKFDIEVYEKYTLIQNEHQFSMIIRSDQVSFLEKNKILYIDRQKYDYTILNVDSNYTNVNDVIYQTVSIDPYNYKTDAIVTECYLLRKKQTIFEFLIEFIKGG